MLSRHGILLLCISVYCVVSIFAIDERSVIDSPNVVAVRLPNMNEIPRGDRMTISVPLMKPSQPAFVRPLPPTPVEGGPNGLIMASNIPSTYYYELFKTYPQHRQHICIPTKVAYALPEASCPMVNMKQQTMHPLVLDTNEQNDATKNKILQIHVPPGLPARTLTKLDKLVATINKSLAQSRDLNTSEDECESSSPEKEIKTSEKDTRKNENRTDKRWTESDRDYTNEEEEVKQYINYEDHDQNEKEENRKWKRSANRNVFDISELISPIDNTI